MLTVCQRFCQGNSKSRHEYSSAIGLFSLLNKKISVNIVDILLTLC